MPEKRFLMGNEILALAARAAGATGMYGYPITPGSEILLWWAKEAGSEKGKKDGMVFVQAEDEIGASFMLLGAVLSGQKAFTATAGPGNVLMQDAFSMCEAMRLPVVAYINQRGGPSTSTVIYSQSEVNLTAFGGNGNGYRIVYAPGNLQELYDYGIKAFNTAWKYRFPTFLLADGYQAKMMGEVEIYEPASRGVEMTPTERYLLEEKRDRPINEVVPTPEVHIRNQDGVEYSCYRNCLNLEEETLQVNLEIKAAWDKVAPEIEEHETYGDPNAEILIVAFGIVGSAAKQAIDQTGGKARLFRPITLRPFPTKAMRAAAKGAKRIIVPESAIAQLSRLVKEQLYGVTDAPMIEYHRPSIGISVEEIMRLITDMPEV
ncbi:MAG: ferredoxin oxidoreductase [Patescibacteria group bacterium]|jgi:2-oxoglutarate ferredoxin oxidoreductase subunit alpha